MTDERGKTIDWQRFSERVPPNCLFRYGPRFAFLNKYCEPAGMLLENMPIGYWMHGTSELYAGHNSAEKIAEELNSGRDYPYLACHRFHQDHTASEHIYDIEYLIDGRWLSYAQIMTGDV